LINAFARTIDANFRPTGDLQFSIDFCARQVFAQPESLKLLPSFVLHQILNSSALPTDDQDRLALLLIDLGCGDSFFHLLQFEFLSLTTMNLVLDAIDDIAPFTEQLVRRARRPLLWLIKNQTQTLRVLDVFYMESDYPHVDFRFLAELNSELEKVTPSCPFRFEVVSMDSVALNAELEKNDRYLNLFDILMFGAANFANSPANPVKREFIESCIVPFWKRGGAVLFFHGALVKAAVGH
jgi:hypothetical protein